MKSLITTMLVLKVMVQSIVNEKGGKDSQASYIYDATFSVCALKLGTSTS